MIFLLSCISQMKCLSGRICLFSLIWEKASSPIGSYLTDLLNMGFYFLCGLATSSFYDRCGKESHESLAPSCYPVKCGKDCSMVTGHIRLFRLIWENDIADPGHISRLYSMRENTPVDPVLTRHFCKSRKAFRLIPAESCAKGASSRLEHRSFPVRTATAAIPLELPKRRIRLGLLPPLYCRETEKGDSVTVPRFFSDGLLRF